MKNSRRRSLWVVELNNFDIDVIRCCTIFGEGAFSLMKAYWRFEPYWFICTIIDRIHYK